MTTEVLDERQAERDARTARLRALMDAHDLSAAEVGTILKRSPQTVRSWSSVAYQDRAIPERILRLLELELAHKNAAAPKGRK